MKRLGWRLVQAVVVMFGVTTVLFLVLRAVPGDPAAIIAGPNATPATIAALRAQYHLNEPLPQQYLQWISSVATGNLGTSITYQVPVASLIGQAIWPSLQLLVAALIVGIGLGVPLGVLAATRRRRWPDLTVSGFTAVALGMPGFWMGILLLLVFAVQLHWVPSGGWANVFANPSLGLETLALPAVTLGVGVAAIQARFARAAMVEALNGDYVRTARAKGASERTVVWRHALRNALVPVVTITGIQVGVLLGGVVVIESVFARPGLGSLVAGAISNRDYPVVQGVTLVLVAAFSVINILVDVIYIVIDPRLRK